MSLGYAILGILGKTPMSGYDIKKLMQTTDFMHWSGNNNQIYKALLELADEGYVTSEVQEQDSLPNKKLYHITADGKMALKRFILSPPHMPSFKNPFLIRLAFSDALDEAELLDLLTRYETEVKLQCMLCKNTKNNALATEQSRREALVLSAVYQNAANMYECELAWVQELKKGLEKIVLQGNVIQCDNEALPEKKLLYYEVVSKPNGSYILINSQIHNETAGLSVLEACAESGCNLVILSPQTLPEDFFRLENGFAPSFLQRLSNYSVYVAVLADADSYKGKFKKTLAALKSNSNLKIFDDMEKAEDWLLSREPL